VDYQTSSISEPNSIRDYIQLTKPGILRSNLFAAFAGFWIAAKWEIDWLLLIYTLIGTTLVLASSCVFNNYLDRDLDVKMKRTSTRALPSGRIQARRVLVYAIILGVLGLATLLIFVNPLSALLGFVGMFVYVVVYTAWLKRTSTLSTVMGSFSGAMPPVIGYVAVTELMDIGAWILFGILFLWQPPHFWALGIRRMEEYRAAGFQILPVVKGIPRTKWQMLPYVVLLIPVSILLYTYNYAGLIYLIAAVVLGVGWLLLCIAGLFAKNDDRWAKRTFMFSIYYLLIIFVLMIVNTTSI
jgi:protoheme IX farnesyltransferase